MAKASKPIAKSKGQPEMFKGGSESLSSWVNLSVVQRWADERMPVSKRSRRCVIGTFPQSPICITRQMSPIR